MLPLEPTLRNILAMLPEYPHKTHTLSLSEASGYISATDIISPINVPSFDNSAMDGYAVRYSDLKANIPLRVVGKSFAGSPFSEVLPPLSAVRIMTGAMLPAGADTIIMQEFAQLDEQNNVTFNQLPQKIGENVRYLGEDVKKGEIVLNKGTKLTALSLPLLASLGITEVEVFVKLKVALLSTGDELVPVGQPLKTGQIYDTNRFTVRLMLEKLPCEILDFGILADNPVEFEKAFINAQKQADVVITSGGVSVGEADFTKDVLEKIGKINFWKLAIKPGKPFAFGQLENAWFCGLPGNPVSALVTFYQIVQPILTKLAGFSQWRATPRLKAIAACNMKKQVGRQDFQRGFYQINQAGQIEVAPVGFQGSHLFSAFVKSNCFIVLEQERGNVSEGENVIIEPFNELIS